MNIAVNNESPWEKSSDWKKRYSKLYSAKRLLQEPKAKQSRISFMSNDCNPYGSLLKRLRDNQLERSASISTESTEISGSFGFNQSPFGFNPSPFGTNRINIKNDNDYLGRHGTMLLNMVRARSKEIQVEMQNNTLQLPKDDESADDTSSEACIHGLSVRMTERSVSRSRSRVSRISTRRDMDIPSILAFTSNISAPPPTHLEIPAFQNLNTQRQSETPRWSIRRSICPVCSQKWKDRSSITNVKYSGLKRNSSSELPTVIAPARLRTSITAGYQPRPALAAVDEDEKGGLRNTSAAWQLTRARRFRAPKPQLPPPEATAPPSSTAPLARKDLDLRVNRFLKDEEVKLVN